MLWTAKHDELLCREILVVNPFTGTNLRTVQRGAKWDLIAGSLNKIQDIYFRVSQRFVRDRYNLLAKQLRIKLQTKKSASIFFTFKI
jgi:hypothetical protein